MASAMSVTCSSSKHSSRASAAITSAAGAIGSSPLNWPNRALRAAASPLRQTSISAWISAMNTWTCTRRFLAIGAESKNRSISMDLPRPTGPQR
jgi:hypothetical protein